MSVLVVYRRSWAGKMVDLVDFNYQSFDHIVTQRLEVGAVQQVLDVFLASREEVVHANDLQRSVPSECRHR